MRTRKLYNGNKNKIAAIALIVLLGLLYQYKYIFEFPAHIHAWAQSDRYALALGFLDNDLNFFKPQTFVHNHQFPHNWEVPSETSITAVDFPVHDYVPALLMKVSGNNSPWIFRTYILLYSFLGLFFLFKLSLAITNNVAKSLLVLVFAATSPVFVYYQGGFLPTIPSLANAMIGIFFYYRYLQENRNKDFWISVVVLTFAALARTTFAIPLIAILCVEFVRLLKKETGLIPKILPVSISIILLLAYLFYNGYLRATYGSMFLNYIMPASSIEHAKSIIRHMYHNWFFHFFTHFHHAVYLLLLLIGMWFFVIRKVIIKKPKAYFGLLTITGLFGCLLFSLLMLRQFAAHDYYFLDTFFLPVIMSLIIILSLIPSPKTRQAKVLNYSAIFAISVLLIIQPVKSQETRRESGFWDKTAATVRNFENSSAFLDSLGVPKTSKILVLDAVAPNIPFIMMQRKGFAIMNTTHDNIEEALTWDYDFIVFQNEYFIPEIYTPYPAILSKIEKIADNGRITVCRRSENKRQSLPDFLGLSQKTPVFEKRVGFDSTPYGPWQNFNPTNRRAFSGTSSGLLTPEIEYGLTYKTSELPAIENEARTLLFSSYFFSESAANCEVVVSIHTNGENIYYKSYNLKQLLRQQGEWEKVSLVFQLPAILQYDDYEFALYLWNTGKSELLYDDFGFAMYE